MAGFPLRSEQATKCGSLPDAHSGQQALLIAGSGSGGPRRQPAGLGVSSRWAPRVESGASRRRRTSRCCLGGAERAHRGAVVRVSTARHRARRVHGRQHPSGCSSRARRRRSSCGPTMATSRARTPPWAANSRSGTADSMCVIAFATGTGEYRALAANNRKLAVLPLEGTAGRTVSKACSLLPAGRSSPRPAADARGDRSGEVVRGKALAPHHRRRRGEAAVLSAGDRAPSSTRWSGSKRPPPA